MLFYVQVALIATRVWQCGVGYNIWLIRFESPLCALPVLLSALPLVL